MLGPRSSIDIFQHMKNDFVQSNREIQCVDTNITYYTMSYLSNIRKVIIQV